MEQIEEVKDKEITDKTHITIKKKENGYYVYIDFPSNFHTQLFIYDFAIMKERLITFNVNIRDNNFLNSRLYLYEVDTEGIQDIYKLFEKRKKGMEKVIKKKNKMKRIDKNAKIKRKRG